MAHYGLFSGVPVLGVIESRLGGVAVDLFFVLSGYLITRILVASKGGGARALGIFYARRSLRIFPLYFLAVFLFAAVIPTGAAPNLPWFLTYTVNFGKVISPGAGWYPLNHLWTLSVEEQFYLAWPLLAVSLSRAVLLRVCAAAIAGGVTVRLLLAAHGASDTAATQLTPCCMDPLMMGCAVALVGCREPPRWALIAFVTAALGVGYMLTAADDFSLVVFARSAHSACFGLGLMLLTRYHVPALDGRVLVYLGTISYGIYVWHMPALWLVRSAELSGMTGLAVVLALTIGLSAMSWSLFEAPINQLKSRFEFERH